MVATSLVWIFNYRLHFNGFFWNDSHDYNQIARNIYEGKGFVTSTLRPQSFVFFKTIPHPEMYRLPIYPYILAGFFKLYGVNDFAAAFSNGLFFVLFIPAVFIFSRELSGSNLIGIFSSVIVLFSKFFLKLSITGSTDVIYTFVFVVFMIVYVKYPGRLVLQGVLIGIMYLFRPNTVFFFLPWVILEFGMNPKQWLVRRADFTKVALSFLVVASIYYIRNYFVYGTPFFSIHRYDLLIYTKTFPGYTFIVQSSDIDVMGFVLGHLDEMIQQMQQIAKWVLRDSLNFYGYGFLFIFGSAFILPAKKEKVSKLKKNILMFIILQTVMLLPVWNETRYYVFVVPVLVTILGIQVKDLLDKKSRLFTYAALAVFIVIVFFSSINWWKAGKPLNELADLGGVVKEITQKNDVIASDIAWEINWYADRKTVWLPYDLETMDKISKSVHIDYVFLSLNIWRPVASYKNNIWQRLFFEAGSFKVPGLKLVKVFYYGKSPSGILYKVETNHKE